MKDVRFAGMMIVALVAVRVLTGCSEQQATGVEKPGDPGQKTYACVPGDDENWCDFSAGPEDAPISVRAFYPGGHEDTLAAIKSLLEEFPGKVRVEIVDWRRPEGLEARIEAGLKKCAGVVINGSHEHTVEADGETRTVSFTRCIDADWTKADLYAVVGKLAAVQP